MCDNKQSIADINSSVDEIIKMIDKTVIDSDGQELGEGTSFEGNSRRHRSTETTVFAEDSFDRFGDDLAELIISYLPLSDKVSLESVSRQWRRTVYGKQTELVLNRSDTEEQNTLNRLLKDIEVVDYATGFAHYAGFKAIDKKSFESFLKKCPHLKKITFQCYIDGEDLQLVGKYCPYLKSLECNPIGLNVKTLSQFGGSYGHKLRVMRFNDSNYCSVFLKKFLTFCPNLTEVYTEENSAFICEDKDFLPKLETIKSIDIRTEQLNQLKILSDKYQTSMKTIKIYTYHMIGQQLKNAITYISQFQNLESLGLCISLFEEDMQTIDENICEISKNCTLLKKLSFTINNESVITNRFFYSFSKLHSIEKLNLEFYEVTKKLEGTVDCFKHCLKLKHLIISYKELTEDFFVNIQTALPELRVLDIDSDKQFSDSFMVWLSGLPKLKKLVVKHSSNAHKDMTDDSICQLLTSCPKIETISFSSRPNITHKTIETLIEVALKRPKDSIHFSCGFSSGGDEQQFTQIDVNSFAQRIPENLKISIDLGQAVDEADNQ